MRNSSYVFGEALVMAAFTEKKKGKNDFVCEHCGKKKTRLKDKCYHFIGFPPNYQAGRGRSVQVSWPYNQLTKHRTCPD